MSKYRERWCEKCGHRTYSWGDWLCPICMHQHEEATGDE